MFIRYALAFFGAALVGAQSESQSADSSAPCSTRAMETMMSSVMAMLPTGTGAAASMYPTGPAPTVKPPMSEATYEAILPPTNFDSALGSTVTGNITISSRNYHNGVLVAVNFHHFPSESLYGPFTYHIHANPVSSNGNCTAAGAHLDPTMRGESPPCNASDKADCQIGDLAGKYGNILTPDFVNSYEDAFLSTDPKSPAFFGDLSVVIHTNNKTRITCANFKFVGGDNGTGNGTGSGQPNGAAGGLAAVGGLMVAAGLFVLCF